MRNKGGRPHQRGGGPQSRPHVNSMMQNGGPFHSNMPQLMHGFPGHNGGGGGYPHEFGPGLGRCRGPPPQHFMRPPHLPFFDRPMYGRAPMMMHGDAPPMMHGGRMAPPMPMGFMPGPMPRPMHGFNPIAINSGAAFSSPIMRGMKRKGGGEGKKYQGKKLIRSDGEYQCDTCDRNYETQEMLNQHLTCHKKCGFVGCAFMAHSKVLAMHIKMQHDTGLATKIMRLTSDEEVDKWRNERKKNYPTADNVARRQAEQAEKFARGELLEDKEFGKFIKMGSGRGRGGGRSSQVQQITNAGNRHTQPGIVDPGYISFEDETSKTNGRSARPPRGAKGRGRFLRGRGKGQGQWKSKKKPIGLDAEAIRDGITKFKGTDSAPVTVTLVSADGDHMPSCSNAIPVPNGNQPATIVAASDFSDSDAPEELSSKVPILDESKKPTMLLPGALASLVAAYESSDVDECIISPKYTSKSLKKSPPEKPYRFRPPKPSLLEMLLAKEIRHERNVILQCIRHIVRNNFFDPSDKALSSL